MEKSKLWMILIIIVLLLMCGGLVFGFIYTINLVRNIEAGGDGGGIPGHNTNITYNPSDLVTFSLKEEIATNLKDSPNGDKHIIKLNMGIELDKKAKGFTDFETMITSKEAYVRSTALKIIRSKTYEELKEDNGEDALANEVLEKLQQEFNTDIIVAVIFDNFMYQ